MDFHPMWVENLSEFPLVEGRPPDFTLPRRLVHAGHKAWAGGSEIGRVGMFWVPATSVFLVPEQIKFRLVKTGDAVRIPLIGYKTTQPAYAEVFAVGVQVGMAAMMHLRNYVKDLPKTVHLAIGDTCDDLRPAEDSFRCYIGMAFEM